MSSLLLTARLLTKPIGGSRKGSQQLRIVAEPSRINPRASAASALPDGGSLETSLDGAAPTAPWFEVMLELWRSPRAPVLVGLKLTLWLFTALLSRLLVNFWILATKQEAALAQEFFLETQDHHLSLWSSAIGRERTIIKGIFGTLRSWFMIPMLTGGPSTLR